MLQLLMLGYLLDTQRFICLTPPAAGAYRPVSLRVVRIRDRRVFQECSLKYRPQIMQETSIAKRTVSALLVLVPSHMWRLLARMATCSQVCR